MTVRTTLPFDVGRCAGRMDFNGDATHWCEQRMSCQRYLAFTQWDKGADIPDYSGIAVSMAVPNCKHKIGVSKG